MSTRKFPTVEVAHTVTTEEYRADPSLLEAAIQLLKNQDGCPKVYHGLQVEDPTQAYLVIPWDTLAHHTKLMNDTETYPVLKRHVSRFWPDVSTVQLIHVEVTSEPREALEAPVTEIVLYTVHEGAARAEVEKLVGALSEAFSVLPESTGARGSAWGPVAEREDQLVLFIGWTSVEAHMSAVRADALAGAMALVADIRKVADIEIVHIKLHQ